jgi:hypothetical protein
LTISDRGYKRVLLIAILLLVFLSGCVTTKTKQEQTEQEGLRERVMAYWNYKIKGEFDKSYGYEDPFYRKSTNLVGYMGNISSAALKWRSAEIEKIDEKGDAATVDLKLGVEVILPQIDRRRSIQMNAPLADKWVKVEGVWYHRPSQRGLKK